MTSKPDSVYYAERLEAELKAVDSATNDAVRRAHQELADHYRQQLAACAAVARGRSEALRPAAE